MWKNCSWTGQNLLFIKYFFHLCNNSEVAVWILPHLQNLDSAQLLSRLPHVTRLILEKCAYKVTLDDFFLIQASCRYNNIHLVSITIYQICSSSASHRCSTGLRSEEFVGVVSTSHSLLCSSHRS